MNNLYCTMWLSFKIQSSCGDYYCFGNPVCSLIYGQEKISFSRFEPKINIL